MSNQPKRKESDQFSHPTYSGDRKCAVIDAEVGEDSPKVVGRRLVPLILDFPYDAKYGQH